jgi:hypothetical protein
MAREPLREEDNRLPLASTIRSLRTELVEAMRQAEGEALRFELGSVELELLVEVQKATSGQGGVRFWVVSLGGERGTTRTGTHRITVSLQPVGKDGRRALVRDDAARPAER